MITLELNTDKAISIRDAIDTVLRECDVHTGEAAELTYLLNRLDFRIERTWDYVTDVDVDC